MKRSSRPTRTPPNLSESIYQQLNMYAIAAAAAGVGVLALAQPAEAKIIYRHTHVVIGINQHYNLDLNDDGITDFTIAETRTYGHCGGDAAVGEKASKKYSNNRVVTSVGSSVIFAAALPQGARIGNTRKFGGGRRPMAFHLGFSFDKKCISINAGPWLGANNCYLGLAFQIQGKTHYGWARLSVNQAATIAQLTGYAYETIPGKAIKAGQTKGAADDPTNDPDFVNPGDPGPSPFLTNPIPDKPQPASLGMLALGAQSVSLWRRKESALEGN